MLVHEDMFCVILVSGAICRLGAIYQSEFDLKFGIEKSIFIFFLEQSIVLEQSISVQSTDRHNNIRNQFFQNWNYSSLKLSRKSRGEPISAVGHAVRQTASVTPRRVRNFSHPQKRILAPIFTPIKIFPQLSTS